MGGVPQKVNPSILKLKMLKTNKLISTTINILQEVSVRHIKSPIDMGRCLRYLCIIN